MKCGTPSSPAPPSSSTPDETGTQTAERQAMGLPFSLLPEAQQAPEAGHREPVPYPLSAAAKASATYSTLRLLRPATHMRPDCTR